MTMSPKLGKKPKTARQIYLEATKKPRAKYGNTQSLCALNHSHRSKLESAVCGILQLRQAAKEIEIHQVEDHVYLTNARIGYVADFRCVDLKTGKVFWVEAKGHETDRWRMIKKLWPYYGFGQLEVWKGDWRRPVLGEVITLKGKL